MTTPAQKAALARIVKLLPSLARDNDNEVVTAARAIGRALGGVDLDFHDLAKLLEGSVDRRGAPTAQPAPTPKPAPAAAWPDFARRPKRDDPLREERAQAYAFGAQQFIPFPVSEALRKEILPLRHGLSADDRALFDALNTKLLRGELLIPSVHHILLDMASKLRKAPP